MTATYTFANTTIDLSTVTAEQIGMAHAVIGPDNKTFYLVENSQGEYDQDGLIEYKVTYSKEFGFQCNCKAGQEGFVHCKEYCWHVRAAIACAIEEREALAEQEQLNAAKPAPVIVTDVDAVTLARVMRRSAEQAKKPASKPAPLRQGTGFSLLKR